MEKVTMSSDKLKNAWEYAKVGFEKDGTYGFSWPQRNYRCSFCKREFKSAQALGGHMNVHRRERAKMRLLPLGDYLNPNHNFFPSSTSSSSTAKLLPCKSYEYSHQNGFSAPSSATADEEKVPTLVVCSPLDPVTPGKLRDHTGKSLNKRALTEVRDFQFLTKGNDSILWKKQEILRVGLSMSFLHDAKDDLDLELRLGHSKLQPDNGTDSL